MKTLDEVEPRSIVSASATPGDAANSFIIRTPGSYYLIGNITAEPGKHGISIQANDVTLDLNGFALLGGGSAFCGVNVPVAQSGFCIRDGSVRGWSGGGVQAGAAVTLAEKLRLTDNVGAIGLLVGNGSMVKDCVATANAIGFRLPDRTHISDCIATLNTGDGFAATSYVSITDCTSSRNGGKGIVVEGSCSVIRCTATRNLPFGNGIEAETGCTVADCTAGNNSNDGISVGPASTVRGCTSRANGNNGISANAGHCHVTGNTSDANADCGIEIRNPIGGNRVDGNSCNLNGLFGFLIPVTSAPSLVIRNSASGNGNNYEMQELNALGPIVDTRNGNPNTLFTSPWANFIH